MLEGVERASNDAMAFVVLCRWVTDDEQSQDNGLVQFSCGQAALIYIKGWFWLDLISIFPLDLLELSYPDGHALEGQPIFFTSGDAVSSIAWCYSFAAVPTNMRTCIVSCQDVRPTPPMPQSCSVRSSLCCCDVE